VCIEQDTQETSTVLEPTLTIADFCRSEKISRAFYYKLQRTGQGPKTFNIGAMVRITPDAVRQWRAAREAEARQAMDKLEKASERARAVRRAASESITKRDSIA
jgi:predicted DNA-binding transcriptional regulator AlpA